MSFVLPAAVAVPLTVTATALAQQPDNNPGGDKGGQGEDFGKSSPTGLLILILFLIAVAFLVRSMTKHLKRVPASFDEEEEAPAEADKAEDEAATPAEAAESAEAAERAESEAPPSKQEKADHS